MADEGEYEYSEQDVGNIPTRKRIVTTSGNEAWQAEREKQHPTERIAQMEKAVQDFRFVSSGDGLLRGKFGRLPTVAEDMLERMANLSRAMDKFNLKGDNLNVSGNFDKGYTVDRQNPCDQQQTN